VLKSEDYRAISGSQKAAILMLALSEEQCTRLFSMMHEDEIKDISSAMSQLGAVRSEVVERLCLDFVDHMGASGNLVGSYESTERLLQKTLPRERATQIMDEIRGPAGRTMWDKLGNVHEAVLANYLKNEYPQTVAVVLSKVRPDHAARVLTMLPDSFAMEVVMRMLRMESVQKDVLDGVERTLRAEFMSNLARSTRRDSHEMMADIFNNLDRQSETRFIAALEERNRESAERISTTLTASPCKSVPSAIASPMLIPTRKRIARLALWPPSWVGTCCCTCTAQRTAPSMLSNTMSSESPPVWTILPPCSAIAGSIRLRRKVRSLSRVPASSNPISRL
jgi:flagellar motor switch protein FliG